MKDFEGFGRSFVRVLRFGDFLLLLLREALHRMEKEVCTTKSHRGEYLRHILGRSIYSTNLYQMLFDNDLHDPGV